MLINSGNNATVGFFQSRVCKVSQVALFIRHNILIAFLALHHLLILQIAKCDF